MRPTARLLALSLALPLLLSQGQPMAFAQRHSAGTSPPTAPPAHSAPQPIVAASSGLGALQFMQVNYGVPAPQSLTRQLETDDDRTRAAALSALGVPSQYLGRGHIPYPHAIDLQFLALGTTDELDAIITVELDQHIVSAILRPEDGNWRRVATMLYAIGFSDVAVTPSTFLRVARSLVQHDRYNAIFHATSLSPSGDFIENEAHLRILNNRAVVTISFASTARTCDAAGPHGRANGCEVIHRWFQMDPADPGHRFLLISGTGRLYAQDAADPLADTRTFQLAHLRAFACQSFTFSDAEGHFVPVTNSAPCRSKR